jgi:hypothetical protein
VFRVYHTRWTRLGKISTSLIWGSAVILVLLSGIAYRVLASRLKLVAETPINLPVSLSEFPASVGDWLGKDVPISSTVQRVAANDDFLSRLYVNKSSNEWAEIYVAYTAQPRTMLGHRPDICYVGSGWIHDGTKRAEFVTSSDKIIPCLIHRFHLAAPRYEERVVLNFYIVNGQVTSKENGFSGVGWRTPNIAGNPACYVAQVQISSMLENSVRSAAEDLGDLILDFFPDANGNVRATAYTETVSNSFN